ncbi:MAG: TIGR01548 family HAD-type hydrolase [Planctomycetota bacterium]|nr:TIGR01548 family HAD-type hydrolase [Planctomycetota bacterium]
MNSDIVQDAAGRNLGPVPRVPGAKAYRRTPLPSYVDLRLDGNEGPGADAVLLTAIADIETESVRRYPDASALEQALATCHGVAGENVFVTAGADEALDRVFRAYGGPDSAAVVLDPTFEMIPRYVTLAGGITVPTPWVDGPFPTEDVLRESSRPDVTVICIVSPNNPTGLVAPTASIRQIAEARRSALVVVDLAYAEYADGDPTREILDLPNVLVVRTLSKAQGLAGLRVGYAIGAKECIAALRAAGSPYPVSGPSLAIAIRALRSRTDLVDRHVAEVRRERDLLCGKLRSHGLSAPASKANFVFAAGPRADWLGDALRSQGILVRRFGIGHETRLRITCPGDPSLFARLCRAVDAALAPEAMLFDVDGVLADVSKSYREAIRATAAGFGVVVTKEDIRALKAEGNANNDWELTRRAMERRGVDIPIETVTARFEEIYQGTDRVPGLRAHETCCVDMSKLTALAGSIPIGIVTGRPRADAARFLEQHGLTEVCAARVCMEDAPLKPRPDPVLRALEQIPARSAWFFGDTPDDIVAARAAGVVPVGVVAPGEDADAARRTLMDAGAARVLTSLSRLPSERSRLFELLEES